ncbi:divergent polysaccharide deacetylase family protein [Bradyrhizobium sp. LHD-71]|uniref:divergent polysaccharide deacetylase family protein n=1 Tax=Bradyrhizobium sp. LHD-71 TaxID=3072141 RepID=UPI0028108FF1|nr:divergent polysaccharide deacetylase family protein [Bradyrhizobium sp. LHD-71]MDQ8729528.1 divergent polysaccharide deacetylase family protein [Bradyrhizobium sp. LHD-71]
MSTDDLSTPLGQRTARKRRFSLSFNARHALAAVLSVFLVGFLGVAIFNDDPLGGEPMARVVIDAGASTAAAKAAPVAISDRSDAVLRAAAMTPPPATEPAAVKPPASPAEHRTVTIIDGSSGARKDYKVPGTAQDAAPAAEPGTTLAAINPRLLESSRYGMIPVAADGLRPSSVYAGGNDMMRVHAATMPAIAIVVQGLGVGAAKTNEAIVKLPPAVTLAFTPYGTDPAKLVERARTQGHEVLLQVPMEPFDYPDNDPGPQTLLTTANAEQNLDRLYWHLSRFQGYAGLANFMGSRFVATDAAMQPVLREAAKRGLAYFDDGSAARSLAGSLAQSQAVPFAKADLTIDVVPTALEIDRALGQLETFARQHGLAVGVASALPISIERIASWAKALEGRGILLVPLTMAMQKSKSS